MNEPVDIPSIEHRAIRKATRRIEELEIALAGARKLKDAAESMGLHRQGIIDDLKRRIGSLGETNIELERRLHEALAHLQGLRDLGILRGGDR